MLANFCNVCATSATSAACATLSPVHLFAIEENKIALGTRVLQVYLVFHGNILIIQIYIACRQCLSISCVFSCMNNTTGAFRCFFTT